MTLEPKTEEKKTEPIPTGDALPPPPKPQPIERKKDKALRIAAKYLDLPESDARNRVREETPCSVSTAHYAVKESRKRAAAEKGGIPERPQIEILQEDKATASFLPEQGATVEEVRPAEPVTEVITPEQQEQLDIFRDMLRGVHVLILSDDGVLGAKYGRKKEQCVQVSDQLYRWLTRRVGVETLEKYDTLLLAISYISLVGGVAKVAIDERRKNTRKETSTKPS